MSDAGPKPPAQFDPTAALFEDLTLSFDAFFGSGTDGVSRLRGRRFLHCNLAGPSLVVLGAGNLFSDGICSACTFTAVATARVIPGAILLEHCRFDDCILSRWALYLPPAAAVAMARDVPGVPLFGLPLGLF